jgi:hypothetical protein
MGSLGHRLPPQMSRRRTARRCLLSSSGNQERRDRPPAHSGHRTETDSNVRKGSGSGHLRKPDDVRTTLVCALQNGAPDTIRTCDLCLRRATLYPAELRVLTRLASRLPSPTSARRQPLRGTCGCGSLPGAKVHTFGPCPVRRDRALKQQDSVKIKALLLQLRGGLFRSAREP